MIRAAVEDVIANNLGTIATVGGSVMVALIAAMGAVWAKRARPGSDVPIKDIWQENRNLVKDATSAREAARHAEDRRDDAVAAAEILWRYVQRLRDAWGTTRPVPVLSLRDREAVARIVDGVSTSFEHTTTPKESA